MAEAAGHLRISHAVIDLIADHTLAFDLFCLLLLPNYKSVRGCRRSHGIFCCDGSLLLIDSLGRSFDSAHGFCVLKNMGNVVSIFLVPVYSDLEHHDPIRVPCEPVHVRTTHSSIALVADWNDVFNR